jgi:hypothetical protein
VLPVTFNQAIDQVIKNNQKARFNPKTLAQLDGYKRPLVSSPSANLQGFGFERVTQVESLQEIIEDMTESNGVEFQRISTAGRRWLNGLIQLNCFRTHQAVAFH